MKTISISQLRRLLRCQESWYRHYVCLDEGDGMTESAALGVAVHAGLASYLAGASDTADVRYAISTALVGRKYRTGVSLGKVTDDALRIVDSVAPDVRRVVEPKLIEYSSSVSCTENVTLEGIIDVVSRTGAIYDFKVGKRPKSQADVDADMQLSAYYYLLYGRDSSPVETSIVNIKTGLRPSIDIVRSCRGPEDAAVVEGVFKAAAAQISMLSEGDNLIIPNPEGWWCSAAWCEYYSSCRWVKK